MRIDPEIIGCMIVLLGRFNPAIFSPAWLAKQKFITDAEADDAKIHILHPEFCQISVGGKNIYVDEGRYTIDTVEAPWVTISDFTVSVFGDGLPHTTIGAMGINRQIHFKVGTEEIRNSIGRLLAPTEPWGEWGEEIAQSDGKTRAGFRSLQMYQSRDPNGDIGGSMTATIQPSIRIKHGAGIYMEPNDHFEVKNYKPEDGCGQIIDTLHKEFENSIKKSDWIIDQIMAIKDRLGEE